MDIKKIKIALAENHTSVLESISDLIEKSDRIEVCIKAENGLELVKRIRESAAPPDICLIDLRMPKLNGFETFKLIKNEWTDTRSIIFTGYNHLGYREKMMSEGANAYLKKDISPAELIRAILTVNKDGIYHTKDFNAQAFRRFRKRPSPYYNMTEIEKRVSFLIAKGYSYAEISKLMNLSVKQVEYNRANIFQKVGVNNKVDLLMKLMNYGFMEINQFDT